MKITEEIKKKLLDPGFYYEFFQMREGFRLIMSYSTPGSQKVTLPNIVLVGYLTHMRNLYDFFYGPGTKNDASSGHYIESWKYKKISNEMNKWRIKINIFLSHLSYARVTQNWEPWPVDFLYFSFRRLTLDFLKELPIDYQTPNLKDLLHILEKEVDE